jgi:hypothetical protein
LTNEPSAQNGCNGCDGAQSFGCGLPNRSRKASLLKRMPEKCKVIVTDVPSIDKDGQLLTNDATDVASFAKCVFTPKKRLDCRCRDVMFLNTFFLESTYPC